MWNAGIVALRKLWLNPGGVHQLLPGTSAPEHLGLQVWTLRTVHLRLVRPVMWHERAAEAGPVRPAQKGAQTRQQGEPSQDVRSDLLELGGPVRWDAEPVTASGSNWHSLQALWHGTHPSLDHNGIPWPQGSARAHKAGLPLTAGNHKAVWILASLSVGVCLDPGLSLLHLLSGRVCGELLANPRWCGSWSGTWNTSV